ncbi:NADH:ubiquinone oxidoreductase subunit M [Paenibacillus darwinianus]|uniref:NADH:ubiquinone oxidoreductase subunit M n=1 Tax=Paenibacillus darwinianus TaxID=1380763 RepID=A0A9W5S0M1_9BACL|nr:NADH-quinone oxidoreductase subunit M [Paenibacillus darwinianus]EXX87444.1 NADH:ubiquinone oxidoreductase subunit M [Paenibacillus darwinianus]EXX87452.1 NADH:ubiquinone oxidoreductase subunit M [Paenibacillus darwinianus]EXX88860.1 NADH:ubiquinone oxidoreductase subunit M [Paenibacillus darwinianus]
MPEQIPWLTVLTFSPLVGILVLLFLPKANSRALRTAAILTTLVPLVVSLWLFAQYDPSAQAGGIFVEQTPWITAALNSEALNGVASYVYEFQYYLAADGLSLPLIVLAALVATMAAFASVHINKRWKAFYIWFLLLETGMLGVFMARDLVLFFLFFELTLISLFFLIGIWGLFNREKAANTFLIYNGLGSAIMLIAFVLLIVTAGFQSVPDGEAMRLVYSGNYETIMANLADPAAYVNIPDAQANGSNPFFMSEGMRWLVFILIFVAFAIKLPVLPFHTWMLRVHAEAPPSVVMIHSGVLLKMGAYGLLRFGVFLFPQQADDAAYVIALLGVANILYGAITAFVQNEFKLVLAYSSISHMGIVLLGIASLNQIGLQGAVFQLVSHGLISALLFLIVGSLYERTGTTDLRELGGLARALPFMSGVLLTAGMASLGLPGLSGFVGEFLAFLGLFDSMKGVTAIAAVGVILTAVYVLRSVLKITFGPMSERYAALNDARLIEAVPMIALLAFILLLGVYPSILTDSMQHGFDRLFEQLNSRVGG